MFAALLLEYDNFWTATVVENRGGDFGAVHDWRAHFRFAITAG